MASNPECVSGYYGDLPYFGPVESHIFFDLVASHRLHKLSAKLMARSRTLEYFVHPTESKLQVAMQSGDAAPAVSKGAKIPPFKFPTLKQNLDSDAGSLPRSEACAIHIKEMSSRRLDSSFSSDEYQVVALDFPGVEAIWTGLLLRGCDAGNGKTLVIANVDHCAAEHSGTGELLISLLLTGVHSIARFIDSQSGSTGGEAATAPMRVMLTVLADEFGRTMADSIQVFAETVLSMSVRREFCDEMEHIAAQANSTVANCDSLAEWTESVRECATDKHEELCDEMDPDAGAGEFSAPVILIVAPHIESVRQPLRQVLLDSYSSEPIRVAQDIDWDSGFFTGSAPVMFLCSTSWINQQGCTGGFDGLLHRLNIKFVVHGGFCEYGTSLTEELANTVSLLRGSCPDSDFPVSIHQRTRPPFSEKRNYPLNVANQSQVENVVLLLFRRFLMHYSPDTFQPYFSLSRSMFLSRRSWDVYLRTLDRLHLAGAIQKISSGGDAPRVELTVLGRSMTHRFRVADKTHRDAHEFSPKDVKTILWAHLFRQTKDVAEEIISENYSFSAWVRRALDTFCATHDINFQKSAVDARTALIKQLAHFGFEEADDAVESRVHYLLSAPFGKRVPLRSHAAGPPATTCRGWYDQAPLRVGLSIEKSQVPAFCEPSSALYCEVEGPKPGGNFRVQCPTEISYPLIVAHTALHTSLHNNCVSLECAAEQSAVPLPLGLLNSHTMNAILADSNSGEVGLWLEGVLADKTPAPSDPSMYRHLLAHKPSLIRFCERTPFRRKRKRVEEPEKVVAKKEEFTGVKPRTGSEEATIEGFIKLFAAMGRDKAEAPLRGKKGFGFLEPSHELHPYYLYVLRTRE